MRIAILTLPLHSNYGGILQAYALQTVLERMGHEVEVLNILSFDISTRWSLIPKRVLCKILGRDIVVFSEKQKNRERERICQNIYAFRNKYIHERVIDSFEDINENDYDCYVVGSDQVWRPKYFKKQWRAGIENAYLSFTNGWNIKRVAYAASFGVDIWELTDAETNASCLAVREFDAISVREDSGVSLVRKYLGKEAIQVIDPTMLLCKEDYIRLIDSSNVPQSNGNLLTYILNKSRDKDSFIQRIAKERNLVPFSVNKTDVKKTASVEQRVLPSVEQWLRGFYDAELVITDSFHACVFSILFGKPFIAIGNSARGNARFRSLLKMFNLECRLIEEEQLLVTNNNLDLSIDWNSVESYRKVYALKSLEYLCHSLE